MFAVQAFPFGVVLPAGVYDSRKPTMAGRMQRVDDARRVLTRFSRRRRGEIERDRPFVRASAGIEGEPLFCRKYSFPIMAAVLLAAFNQLTGINALLYYAPKVFTMGNSDAHAALLQSIPVGIMLVISTTFGMMLIDRFGRKTLLLVGSVGMVVFLALVAIQFYTADGGRRHRPEHHVVFRRLYPLLRFFAGRGDLGVHFRDLSQRGAGERASPG